MELTGSPRQCVVVESFNVDGSGGRQIEFGHSGMHGDAISYIRGIA